MFDRWQSYQQECSWKIPDISSLLRFWISILAPTNSTHFCGFSDVACRVSLRLFDRIGRLVKVKHRELKQCTGITSFQFELIVQKELWIKLFVAKLKGRYSSILRSFKGPTSLVPKSAEDSWWFLVLATTGCSINSSPHRRLNRARCVDTTPGMSTSTRHRWMQGLCQT